MIIRSIVLMVFITLLCGCSFFETRTTTDETRETNTVKQQTRFYQVVEQGVIIDLKETTHTTEISNEVARIKADMAVSFPPLSTGMNLTSMLSGGGVGAAILAFVGKKMWDRKPPSPPRQPTVKGRSREDES